jgi:pimeloyl-ACP methyl ester carboxylesterase
MADLGGAVADWLVAQDVRGVLVGHSVGAQVAAHAAAQAPARADLLVLHGPTADPAYRTRPRLFSRWAMDMPHEPPSLLATQGPEWLRAGPRRLVHLSRACVDDFLDATVAQVRCPVRVVLGEGDTLCRREWAQSLSGVPPLLIAGAHSAVYSHPAAFARAVTDLVERSG